MFRSAFQVSDTIQDPHQIHEKILLAAKRSGVISLSGRGLSYGIVLFLFISFALIIIMFLLNKLVAL